LTAANVSYRSNVTHYLAVGLGSTCVFSVIYALKYCQNMSLIGLLKLTNAATGRKNCNTWHATRLLHHVHPCDNLSTHSTLFQNKQQKKKK